MARTKARGGSGRSALSHEFSLHLVQMAHRWRRVLDAALRPVGLSQSTWRALVHLAHMGDGILQKDLAIGMGIEGPSLVRLLDNLEKDGLIDRRADDRDRRAKALYLTPLGRARHRDVTTIADAVRAQLLANSSEADMRTCLKVFDEIRAIAEQHLTEQP